MYDNTGHRQTRCTSPTHQPHWNCPSCKTEVTKGACLPLNSGRGLGLVSTSGTTVSLRVNLGRDCSTRSAAELSAVCVSTPKTRFVFCCNHCSLLRHPPCRQTSGDGCCGTDARRSLAVVWRGSRRRRPWVGYRIMSLG
ncbi:hypothetical protein AALO_G00292160 [Alosa alosa]|uniref:Uncharacterized protein n=1 Tax=Alosa alosa TaxID=278164 RepID=A0AAV6FH12_9TELE|nr:hypothetical protein AALO_G00292160 [Alosa alosa]